MFAAIKEGLKNSGLELYNLDFIAIGTGPGSYTGIRVGAVTAKTLAYALNIPLIGISTLQCFTPDQDGNFLVAIDAKIGGAYIISGTQKNGLIHYSCQPQIIELADLDPFLSTTDIIVTPNATQLKQKIETLHTQKSWDWQIKAPNPEHIANLCIENFKNGKGTKDIELLYLRKTQAEREREIRCGKIL